MPAAKRAQPKAAARIADAAVEPREADARPQIEPGMFNVDELRTKRNEAAAAGDAAATAHLDNLIRDAEAAAQMNT